MTFEANKCWITSTGSELKKNCRRDSSLCWKIAHWSSSVRPSSSLFFKVEALLTRYFQDLMKDMGICQEDLASRRPPAHWPKKTADVGEPMRKLPLLGSQNWNYKDEPAKSKVAVAKPQVSLVSKPPKVGSSMETPVERPVLLKTNGFPETLSRLSTGG